MRSRTLAIILGAGLGAGLLLGCGEDRAEEIPGDPALDTLLSPIERTDADVFVGEPAAADQLVFVGDGDAPPPADRADGVFVPLSTFSVERDGIPNEFPSADSMAAMLQAAGVRGDRVVIVAEPIPNESWTSRPATT